MQRYDWVDAARSNSERHCAKLVADHLHHLKAYLHAPLEDKYMHYTRVMRVWRELVANRATVEARRQAVNYAYSLGKVRVGIPR